MSLLNILSLFCCISPYIIWKVNGDTRSNCCCSNRHNNKEKSSYKKNKPKTNNFPINNSTNDIPKINSETIVESFQIPNDFASQINKCSTFVDKLNKIIDISVEKDYYPNIMSNYENIFEYDSSCPYTCVPWEENNCELQASLQAKLADIYFLKFLYLLKLSEIVKYKERPVLYELVEFVNNCIKNPNINDNVSCLNIEKEFFKYRSKIEKELNEAESDEEKNNIKLKYKNFLKYIDYDNPNEMKKHGSFQRIFFYDAICTHIFGEIYGFDKNTQDILNGSIEIYRLDKNHEDISNDAHFKTISSILTFRNIFSFNVDKINLNSNNNFTRCTRAIIVHIFKYHFYSVIHRKKGWIIYDPLSNHVKLLTKNEMINLLKKIQQNGSYDTLHKYSNQYTRRINSNLCPGVDIKKYNSE